MVCKIAIYLAMMALLFGCEDTKQIASFRPVSLVTIMIPPGFKVSINSKPATLFGFESCIKNESEVVFTYGSIDEASSECLLIKPITQKILVKYVLENKVVIEEWMVSRKPEHPMYLLPPNGATVIAHSLSGEVSSTIKTLSIN